MRSRQYLVLQRDITEPLTASAAPSAVSFRAATVADINTRVAAGLGYGDDWKRDAANSVAGGNSCVIGEADGRAVYTGWLSFDAVAVPPRSFLLGPGWAYFHDVRAAEPYDTPEVRFAGLSYRMHLAAERGARNGLNLVYAGDTVGLHAMQEAGFVVTGDIKRSRILRHWWWDRYPDGFEQHLLQGCAAETIAAVKAAGGYGHRLAHG